MNALYAALKTYKTYISLLVCVLFVISLPLAGTAETVDDTFSRAVNSYIEGEEEQSRQLLEEVLQRSPDHTRARELYSDLDVSEEAAEGLQESSPPAVEEDEPSRADGGDEAESDLDFRTFSPDSAADFDGVDEEISVSESATDEEQVFAEVPVEEVEGVEDEGELPEFDPLDQEEIQAADTAEEVEEAGEKIGEKEFITEDFPAPPSRSEAVHWLRAEEYEDRVRFTIQATGTIDYITSYIYDPPMIIVDVPGAINELPDSPLDISMGNVLRVRHSQYRIDPFHTTRVVLDLEEWSENYRVERISPGNKIVVDVFDPEIPDEEIEPPEKVVEDPPEVEPVPGFERVTGEDQEIDLEAEAPDPLTVLLTDEEGEPRVDREVLFEVVEGDGRVDARPEEEGLQRGTTTDEEGRAAARFHAGREAGLNVVEAYVPAEDEVVTFHITVRPGEPEQLVKIAGDRQEVTFGSEIVRPLVVEVQDAYGNPVPDVRVRAEDLTGEGLIDLDWEAQEIRRTARTDDAGRLEIDFYRISPTRRENRVRITVPLEDREDLTATFTVLGRPQLISVSFSEAPLLDVVRTLAEIAGWNIAFPDTVDGQPLEDMLVSVHLEEVTALRALDTILDIKDLTRVADGNIMKIVAKPEAARQGVPVLEPQDLADYPGNNMVTVTYNLSFLEATDDLASRLQQALLAPESTLVADESSNALVVTDLVNNQRRLWQIINQIDQPDQLFEVRVFNLDFREAEEMASNIESLLPTGQGNVVANRAKNALLVFADPGLMSRIEALVEGVDTEGALPGRLEVVNLEGYDVENIAQQVNAVLGLQPVPLSEILDFDIEIEDADELREMLEAGRRIELGTLLGSASVIPLPEVERILMFGPKDIRVMAHRIIEQVKRDAGEYLQRKSWRWFTFQNLSMEEGRRFINRMGGLSIEARLETSGAFLLSADSEERLDMFEDFIEDIDRDIDLPPEKEIIIYTPQSVAPDDLGDDIEDYYDDLQDVRAPDQEATPRVLLAEEDMLILVVSPTEADFVRRLLDRLDTSLADDHQILNYAPRYIDAEELSDKLEDRNIGRLLYEDEDRISLLVPTENYDRHKSLIEDIDAPGITTRVYHLRNTRAEELVDTLEDVQDHTDLRVSFSADEPTNTLIYTAPRNAVTEVENLISDLDQWQRQVFIEGIILEYTMSEGQEFGARWIFDPEEDESPLSGDVGIVESGAGGYLDAGGDFQAILNENQFQAVLNFMEDEGEAEVMAKPQISAINNREASFQKGIERQERVAVGTGEDREITLVPVEAFIELTVTPTITRDRFVRMDLLMSKDDDVTEGDQIRTDRRTLRNSVLIQDGQTVVLGGLIEEDVRMNETGIPYLKDVPVLGNLFKSSSESLEKNELIVFLTPHVIENPAEADRTTRMVSEQLEQITPIPVNPNIDGFERISQLDALAPERSQRIELAQRIVQHREQEGPFRSLQELTDVPGIDEDILGDIAYRTEVGVNLNTASFDDLARIKNIDVDLARAIVDERDRRQSFRSLAAVEEILQEHDIDPQYYSDYLRPIFVVSGAGVEEELEAEDMPDTPPEEETLPQLIPEEDDVSGEEEELELITPGNNN